jgi:hypothetical protein
MYEFCQRKRHLETQALTRAVDVIERKRAQRQTKMGEARASRIAESSDMEQREN